ncbi:MAG: membrane dipeptidase [Anaerolineales bacterium]|jgi:membrane dipeptidase
MPTKFKLTPQINRVGKEYIVPLSEEQEARAMDLHENSIVFDLHMHGVVYPEDVEDINAWMKTLRYEMGYAGIKRAGLTAFIDGVASMAHTWSLEDAVRELGLRGCDLDHNYDKVIRATRAEDVYRAKKEGKTAIFTCIENAEPVGNDLDNLDLLYGMGVRAMGLCYNKRSLVGDGRTERTDSGLSNFGLRYIERMNDLGMIVDAAHAGVRTTIEAAEASQDPIIISHTGAAAVHNTGRMARDEELVAVTSKGGLIGIHSGPNVLSDATRQGVEDMIDHLDYCVDLVGIDHVAIGSDNYFGDKNAVHAHTIREHAADGLQNYLSFAAPYMEGIENPSEWPNITRELVRRGYSDEVIQKLISGNTLRLIEQVIG